MFKIIRTPMNQEELITNLTDIADKLGGIMKRTTTYDSTGRTSKKITIEYDVKHEKRK